MRTSPATSATAVDAVDLVKTYRTGRRAQPVRALNGLSLDITAGSVFALLGPNGAGKSTTVKILTTLSRPDAGRASVAGIDVLDQPDAVRRLIGLVSQKSSTDPMATARENLVLAGRIQGLSHASSRSEPANCSPLPARRCRQPAREDPLGVDVPEARRRHGADAPAPGVVLGRAHHGPRPGARRDVGRDRAGSRTTST